jgi:hypothetical protein
MVSVPVVSTWVALDTDMIVVKFVSTVVGTVVDVVKLVTFVKFSEK